MIALTDYDQELLEFERRWPRHCGDKMHALREYFGLSTPDYERQLARVLDLPAAEAYAPELVRRVRRQRRGLQWFNDRSAMVDWR